MEIQDAEKLIRDIGMKEQDKLDKVILLVSSGTLVLAINLLFVQKIYFESLWLLFTSWFFFVLAIISHIAGYFFSVKSASVLLGEILSSKPRTKKYSKLVEYCNNSSFFSVIAGILFIIVFAGINFNKLNIERRDVVARQSEIIDTNLNGSRPEEKPHQIQVKATDEK